MRRPTARLLLTLIASLSIFSTVFSQKEKERIVNYVQQYKELAMAEMKRTGIPASITLAQGLLETGYGQSDLALNANNHFGIKCKSDWTGQSVSHDDDSKGECFRKYASVEDSYRDHSEFLRRPNYTFLFAIDPKDYQGWAYGLKKAGYATNPIYAQKLIKFIEENDLQQYTLEALGEMPLAEAGHNTIEAKQGSIATKSAISLPGHEIASGKNATALSPDNSKNQKHSNYPKEKTFAINGSKVLYVNAGTSLFALATNNGISFSKLLEFNDLDKVDILDKDELIFLEKKQKKGEKDFHVVEANETLHDICQQEGIQINSILEFNHLTKSTKPGVGQRLYLKSAAPASERLAGNINSESRSM